MKRSVAIPVVIALSLVLIACCLSLCFWAVLAYFPIRDVLNETNDPQVFTSETSPTPVVIRPDPPVIGQIDEPPALLAPEATPNPTVQPDPVEPAIHLAQLAAPADTLKLLEDTTVPINDLYELAARLQGKQDVPASLEAPAFSFQTGDDKSFWVSNTDTNDYYQVDASLRYITDHAYFWIEDGVSYREAELADLAEAFENTIYPTNREFFGSEWTPGVDGDPHIYILYTSGVGSGIAGYFSSNDSYNPEIQEYSNGHDMFVFNADNVALDEEFTYGVLAHEFQHMIHWYRDRNEATWVNEGFSDVAMLLNDYDTGGHDYLYALDPDLQLNDWPNDSDLTSPHYGASFLYLTYFLDRFGESATQALVNHPADGLEGVDQVLDSLSVTDPLTGQPIRADDLFADWVVANYLKDGSAGDGRYTYHNYPEAPQPSETESIRNCDHEIQTRDVRQYGVDYIQIECQGNQTLNFEGSILTSLLPASAHSGEYAFWSNKGDESDMTLTQLFDFSGQSGPLTLEYWTWYDIEEDFDYAYLLASEDGERWEMLFPPSGTGEDPTGANYGWGYNGASEGGPEWVQESVDLSQYAGKQVYLRFEYITDAAVNGEGLLVDDISIPEIGYFSDFEQDDGGWQAQGFARVQNALPQHFRLSLITRRGGEVSVTPVQLSADNSASLPLLFDEGVDEAVLAVSGTTRFTRQPAAYRFFFQP
jgi:hypothetical protein